jgi:hypothetical protein
VVEGQDDDVMAPPELFAETTRHPHDVPLGRQARISIPESSQKGPLVVDTSQLRSLAREKWRPAPDEEAREEPEEAREEPKDATEHETTAELENYQTVEPKIDLAESIHAEKIDNPDVIASVSGSEVLQKELITSGDNKRGLLKNPVMLWGGGAAAVLAAFGFGAWKLWAWYKKKNEEMKTTSEANALGPKKNTATRLHARSWKISHN